VTNAGLPSKPGAQPCTHRYVPLRLTGCADAPLAGNAANRPVTNNNRFIWHIDTPPHLNNKQVCRVSSEAKLPYSEEETSVQM
jgi:hypothetical protein